MRKGSLVRHPYKKDKSGNLKKGKITATYPHKWEVTWEDGTKTLERELKRR